MKKSFYLILVSFMLLMVSVAQSQTTYFLKNNGDYAPSRKAADFIRIVENREGEMGLLVAFISDHSLKIDITVKQCLQKIH